MALHNIINFALIIIGVYMFFMNFTGGLLTPPVVSGLAFVLIGVKPFLR